MTSTVSVSRVVSVTPDRAFELFTEEVGDWYRVDRFTVVDPERTVSIRFEPYVGGRFMDVYDVTTGEGRELARIQAWDPPHRLQFVDTRDCEVEVTFVAAADGTRVTIEQRGLDRLPPAVADHVERFGWHVITPWFAEYAQGNDKENR
jgi:Activator of Hsp90 ATPase homolog 1-like protein